MKNNYFLQLSKKLAVVTGIIGLGTFVSVPAMAQVNATQTNDRTPRSPGVLYSQKNPSSNNNPEQTANLVEVATTKNYFNTLLQAAKTAGLANTLTNPGPYTIFAPTDEAFASLPPGTMDVLLKPENRGLLREVLRYHVVRGRVTANELRTGTLNTLGGGVAVRVTSERIILNNGSVIQPNIQASNGVIHAVNRLLIPQKLQERISSLVTAR